MAHPNIKPLGNRLLVKRKKPQASKGGILLPESAQEKPLEGEILASGPGKIDEEGRLIPMDVQIGDRVLFGGYAGTKVETESSEEEYLILSQDEILGVLVAQ